MYDSSLTRQWRKMNHMRGKSWREAGTKGINIYSLLHVGRYAYGCIFFGEDAHTCSRFTTPKRSMASIPSRSGISSIFSGEEGPVGSVEEITPNRCRFSISLCYKLRCTGRRLNDALSMVNEGAERNGEMESKRSIKQDKVLECSRTKPSKNKRTMRRMRRHIGE